MGISHCKKTGRPWAEAEQECREKNGNLLHIMNEAEQKDYNLVRHCLQM